MERPVNILSYQRLRELSGANHLRQAEVPVGYSVSLPIPTNRFDRPAYVMFAAAVSPLSRLQGPPDRWWALDAQNGHLLLYAMTAIHPFSDHAWSANTLPQVHTRPEEFLEQVRELHALIEAIVPEFFAGLPGDEAQKREAGALLSALVPQPLQPQYRAIAPDFYQWLGAD